jgi:hypothetical protein
VHPIPVQQGGGCFGSTSRAPGGRTWGLTKTGNGTWQVSPSINVLNDRDAINGTHNGPSLWHQTPSISGVPDDEVWAMGVPMMPTTPQTHDPNDDFTMAPSDE